MYEHIAYNILLVVHGLAVVINATTVVVIMASRRLRKTQNIFTGNIALVDCVASSLVIVTVMQAYLLDKTVPVVYLTMRAALFSGIFSTLAVAIQRFIIVRFDPFNKRNLVTAPRCIAVCVVIWIIPFATIFTIRSIFPAASLETLIMPIMTFASHALSAICYAIVYLTVAGAARKAGLSDQMLVLRVKQNKKVLTTFALVVVTNIVCLFPLSLGYFISYLRVDWVFNFKTLRLSDWFRIFASVSRGLVGLNGILNPIIYWTRLTDFRNLLNLLRPCTGVCNARSGESEGTKNEVSLQTQESIIPDPKEGDRSTSDQLGMST